MNQEPADRLQRAPDRHRPLLTDKRLTILRLYANGFTTQQVADQLGCTIDNIGTQTRIICQRLGARDRTHAVAVALARRLISASDIRIPEPDPPRIRGPLRKADR
jgi:DNA-binding NarL/FixJ family response regulator